MYATIVVDHNGDQLRSSVFWTLDAAIEHAERIPGIVEIIDLASGCSVWERSQYAIQYTCECGETWHDLCNCPCDGECPRCGATDIAPTSWELID